MLQLRHVVQVQSTQILGEQLHEGRVGHQLRRTTPDNTALLHPTAQRNTLHATSTLFSPIPLGWHRFGFVTDTMPFSSSYQYA